MFEKWYRKMEPCGPSLWLPNEMQEAPLELMQVLLRSQGSSCRCWVFGSGCCLTAQSYGPSSHCSPPTGGQQASSPP